MKRFISFGSIDQFGTIVKKIQYSSRYIGHDENDNAIYDELAPMPIVTATASEKIHGTNAAVCFGGGDFWVQSRKNIIDKEKDNAGCAAIIYGDEKNPGTLEYWMEIIGALALAHNIDLEKNIISVYFEWSGGNIFSGSSCMTGLDKRAVIFQHFKVSPLEADIGNDGVEQRAYWLETYQLGRGWLNHKEVNIFNIMQYKTWEFEIDFSTPKLFQNAFIELVEKTIEPDSPLGKSMGQDGNVGEGAVFTFMYKDTMHRFKVKGDKHSKSKVKKLKPVDNEKEQLKIDIATQITPGWRLEQMYAETFDTINGGKGSRKGTGDFIKAVNRDILKEETSTITDAGLIPGDIWKYVSNIIRPWLFEQIDKEVGL